MHLKNLVVLAVVIYSGITEAKGYLYPYNMSIDGLDFVYNVTWNVGEENASTGVNSSVVVRRQSNFTLYKWGGGKNRNDWYPVSGCTHTIVSHCQIQENIGFFEYSVFWITRSDQSSNISIPNIPDNQIIVYQPLEKMEVNLPEFEATREENCLVLKLNKTNSLTTKYFSTLKRMEDLSLDPTYDISYFEVNANKRNSRIENKRFEASSNQARMQIETSLRNSMRLCVLISLKARSYLRSPPQKICLLPLQEKSNQGTNRWLLMGISTSIVVIIFAMTLRLCLRSKKKILKKILMFQDIKIPKTTEEIICEAIENQQSIILYKPENEEKVDPCLGFKKREIKGIFSHQTCLKSNQTNIKNAFYQHSLLLENDKVEDGKAKEHSTENEFLIPSFNTISYEHKPGAYVTEEQLEEFKNALEMHNCTIFSSTPRSEDFDTASFSSSSFSPNGINLDNVQYHLTGEQQHKDRSLQFDQDCIGYVGWI